MAASIEEFGFKIPVLARSSGEVVDGHLRLKAARKLGITEVPVILCGEWTEFASFRTVVKRGASLYICHSSSFQREFQSALEAAGFNLRCQIIWAKNTFAWGFGRYKFQHEPIFYAHLSPQSDAWYGDKSQSTFWMEKNPGGHHGAVPFNFERRGGQIEIARLSRNFGFRWGHKSMRRGDTRTPQSGT
jgi:hypothetical protein